MSKRHKKQHVRISSWSLVADGCDINVDDNIFHNLDVAGLVKLTRDKCPQWKELVFTQHVVVNDTQKRNGSSIIHKNDIVYKIGLVGTSNVGVLKVDRNLKNVNGVVPQTINDLLSKMRE